jgi:hypothetical protein
VRARIRRYALSPSTPSRIAAAVVDLSTLLATAGVIVAMDLGYSPAMQALQSVTA